MKNTFFFLMLLALFWQARAQDFPPDKPKDDHEYVPLAIEGSQWVVEAFDQEEQVPIGYHGYKIKGDTIINDTLYKKVYKREFQSTSIYPWGPYFTITGEYYYAAIRDDIENRKVYAKGNPEFCSLTKDYLLYDYSLDIGDFFTGNCIIVDGDFHQVEEKYLSNLFNKNRIVLKGNFDCITLFEGIGSEHGLFEGVGCIVKKNLVSHWLFRYCVGNDDVCLDGFLASVTKISKSENYFSVNPIPVKDKMQITINTSFRIENCSFNITDITGKTLKLFKLKTACDEINVTELKNGIYFLNFYYNNQYINTKKIIII